MLHQLDIKWYAFLVLNELDLGILEIVLKYQQTSPEDFYYVFLANFVAKLLVSLQVGEVFDVIPHVVRFRHSLVNPQEVMFIFLLQGHELGYEAFLIDQTLYYIPV